MKRILFILSMLIGVAYGQVTGHFRYDSTMLYKNGGNNELILLNSTRGVTGGVLTNMGNGRTRFVTPSGSTNTSIGSGYKISVNGTNNVKSLVAGNVNIVLDSAIAGQIGIKTADSLKFASGSEPEYILRHRNVALGFPVATLKPKLAGNMAFDIMPMGTPGNYSDNGITWMDICDANVVEGSGNTTTARVGITGSAVQFGMRAFGSAEKKVNIIMGTDSMMTFLTNRNITMNTADFTMSKNTVGNNIHWLLNPNTGNSAALFIVGQDFAANKIGFVRYENDGQTGGGGYQRPNQFEVMANNGAVNGMVVGTTDPSGGPFKIVQNGIERVRYRADSVLWLTIPRITSTSHLLSFDSTTKQMTYIPVSSISGGGGSQGLQDVIDVDHVLDGSTNTIDLNSGSLILAGGGAFETVALFSGFGYALGDPDDGVATIDALNTFGALEITAPDSILLNAAKYLVAGLQYLPGASTKMMVWDSLTDKWGTQPISSGGSPTLTATRVGYGDGSNVLTGEAAFTYDATNNVLHSDYANFGPSSDTWWPFYGDGWGYVRFPVRYNGVIESETGTWRINSSSGVGSFGTISPDASAKVEIVSTTQGFLPPRMTTTQKNAISSPAEGLVIYDLTLKKLCVYTGAAWETITSL